MYRISLLVAFFAIGVSPAFAGARQLDVVRADSVLDAAPFERALWGILLVDAAGDTIYSRNAERLFVPASSAKLVVASIAATLLDSSFQVSTDVYASGELKNGILAGDLVVVGHGDPTFDARCYGPDTTLVGTCETMWSRMDSLARALATTGLRYVLGDIVGDGSYFEPTLVHPAWEVYDVNWWYAAPVSALSFNDNSLNVTWGPGRAKGMPGTVSFEPNLGDFIFENRTLTVDTSGETTVDFFRGPGRETIRAEGTVPANRSQRTEYFSVPDPNLYFVTALRSRLELLGISIAGRTLATTNPTTFQHVAATEPLVSFASRPLSDLVYPILKSSQNLFAESLLKILGARLGKGGSWEEGVALETSFLIDSVGIDSTAFQLHDGSGLASINVLSPKAFVQLLTFMENHPRNGPLMNALPRSGQPGSLQRRFVGTPLEGRVIAKTGSISHVNSLNGYVETEEGTVKFSITVNNQTAGYTAAVNRIDEFLVTALGSMN